MAARQRLQAIFAKYDGSGDGVLSESEMKNVFEKLGISDRDTERIFKAADGNKDGVIQVPEFISWMTSQKRSVTSKLNDEDGTVTATMFNSYDRAAKRFTLTLKYCKNLAFPEGNPAVFLLKPGEVLEKVVGVAEQKGQECQWRIAWQSRSEFAGIEDDPNAFKDSSFPHDDSSIGESTSRSKVGEAEVWARARVLGDPAEACLFDEILPQDILQGSLGDCWLMAALSSLADHPDRIKALFNTTRLSDDGKYEVQLFDIETLAWTTIEIDEFVPCRIRKGVPLPVFAKSLGEEIWVMLLEKAFAKFVGRYGALSGGRTAFAWQALTGEVNIIRFKKLSPGNWRRMFMSRQRQLEHGARKPQNAHWHWNTKDMHSPEGLFELIQNSLSSQHLVGCMLKKDPESEKFAKANGVYAGHWYSLLKATVQEMDDGTPVKLVMIRNPWGHAEWSGDWSDHSERWKQNPKLAATMDVETKNDGRAWMPFTDWETAFTIMEICPSNDMPPPNEDELDENAEEDDEDSCSLMGLSCALTAFH